ncbi:MAG: hypothetical protein HC936_05110 [Leptolyngbyaceae cyanobacterium SU_3_3]|nr:hypothetical protein [Leptolyngbyaceae cyanobacterium SU_3_3]
MNSILTFVEERKIAYHFCSELKPKCHNRNRMQQAIAGSELENGINKGLHRFVNYYPFSTFIILLLIGD